MRTAQIDVAVLQAHVFSHAGVLFHGERRRARFVEYPDIAGHYFHFAGGQVGIHRAGAARGHRAFHRDHVFRPHLLGAPVHALADVFVKHHLRQAPAVAQIDEDDSAMVAPAMHPAHEHDALPASAARSSPQVWVRRRSPKKSNATEVSIILDFVSCRAETRGDFLARHLPLLAARHIFQRVAAGGHFLFAQDQGEARAQLVGQFHGAFQFSLGQFHRDSAAPQIARQHGRMAQRRLAQRGDEQVQRLGGLGVRHRHHQPIFADRKADARRMDLRAQRFRQPVVAAAAQHRVLRAQRAMHHFEGRAHVIVQAAHQPRPNLVGDAAIRQIILHRVEMRAAGVAQAIGDVRQLVDDGLVSFHFAIEHAQRIGIGAALAIAAHGVRHRFQLLAQPLHVLRPAIGIAHGIDQQLKPAQARAR